MQASAAPVLPWRLLVLLLESELISEHISKIRVITLLRISLKNSAWVCECVCQSM